MIRLKLRMLRMSAAVLTFFMLLTILGGCKTANHGRLESNSDITSDFEAYKIIPDHTYYYRGSASRPIAIVGIHKDFELNSKLWVEVDPQSKDFRSTIDRISVQGMGGTTRPWGFRILDHSDRKVGVWYSASRAAAVEVNENNQIVKLTPITLGTIGNQGP